MCESASKVQLVAIMDLLHWQCYFGKTLEAATEYVLALATLGDVTRNRNNPLCVVQPKVAKARTMAGVACHCHRHLHDKLC